MNSSESNRHHTAHTISTIRKMKSTNDIEEKEIPSKITTINKTLQKLLTVSIINKAFN